MIKDAGDDPDVTHKAEICARVTWSEHPGVHLTRGVGVGLVTKKGLPVPVGEPAINPVPRQMLLETVQEILASAPGMPRGVTVEISVPNGAELAKKTLNPRLGIVDGISILGTTGIVVPYSTAAWEASVVQNIDVAVAQQCEHLVFIVGGRGERFAQRLFALPEIAFVQIGDFFGLALRHAVTAGAGRVTLASMVGKLAKFAAGNESVHSRESSQDFALLGELARSAGAAQGLVQHVRRANTAQEVSELMTGGGWPPSTIWCARQPGPTPCLSRTGLIRWRSWSWEGLERCWGDIPRRERVRGEDALQPAPPGASSTLCLRPKSQRCPARCRSAWLHAAGL